MNYYWLLLLTNGFFRKSSTGDRPWNSDVVYLTLVQKTVLFQTRHCNTVCQKINLKYGSRLQLWVQFFPKKYKVTFWPPPSISLWCQSKNWMWFLRVVYLDYFAFWLPLFRLSFVRYFFRRKALRMVNIMS